jgi:hypothetical protein
MSKYIVTLLLGISLVLVACSGKQNIQSVENSPQQSQEPVLIKEHNFSLDELGTFIDIILLRILVHMKQGPLQ